MKTIYFFFFAIALSHGKTRLLRKRLADIIGITSYENENNYDGSYHYRYETENGISVEEEGSLKPGGENGEGIQTARGSYSYTGPDGNPISVTWYADETGFHAEGDHIPKPPEQQSSPRPPIPKPCFPFSKDPRCPPQPPRNCYPGNTDPQCPQPSCYPGSRDPKCPPPPCVPGNPDPRCVTKMYPGYAPVYPIR